MHFILMNLAAAPVARRQIKESDPRMLFSQQVGRVIRPSPESKKKRQKKKKTSSAHKDRSGRPTVKSHLLLFLSSLFVFVPSQTVETVQPLPRPSPRPRPLPATQESFSQASPHVKEFYNQFQEVSQQNRPLSVHGAIQRPPSGGGARKCDRWPCQPLPVAAQPGERRLPPALSCCAPIGPHAAQLRAPGKVSLGSNS